MTRSTTGAIRWCRRSAIAFTQRSPASWCLPLGRSPDQVDRTEERDPDDVDEVPVVGDHDRRRGLVVPEPLGGEGPAEQEEEGEQSADHVQPVEPGGQVEHRPVGVGRDGQALLDELGILEHLAADERRPHPIGERHPLVHAPPVDLQQAPGSGGLEALGGQVFEYSQLVQEGLTISSSPYGSVFYLTTGFHGLHVIGGLLAFLFLLGRSFAAKRFGHHEATTAIVVSYYWHFVDVVWIALFGAIYLIR